jgi:hypothetical protein
MVKIFICFAGYITLIYMALSFRTYAGRSDMDYNIKVSTIGYSVMNMKKRKMRLKYEIRILTRYIC